MVANIVSGWCRIQAVRDHRSLLQFTRTWHPAQSRSGDCSHPFKNQSARRYRGEDTAPTNLLGVVHARL